LLALGISGGLLPCPSALVVLLSAIALGRTGFGLLLVLAFSLGLAGVLTGLGLLLVYAKRLFEGLPTQVRWVRALPAVSALCVALIGLGITTQALMQIGLVRL
jgi:ABC-type nickel/cobalt efflux system permease component RcnA